LSKIGSKRLEGILCEGKRRDQKSHCNNEMSMQTTRTRKDAIKFHGSRSSLSGAATGTTSTTVLVLVVLSSVMAGLILTAGA
jgi:hypothetical protein